MVLGKVIKLYAWIKITRLCGEKKNTNKRTSKQTKQNESNNNKTKPKLINQLTFSFSLPKFFPFFFSFFDFLLDGPFVVLSVKTTTNMNVNINRFKQSRNYTRRQKSQPHLISF